MKTIKDDDYKIIHEDVRKIRKRPTQFVSALGDVGTYHLCKELIDNASDEALKQYSPCDSIYIYITDKMIRVIDNGRGIPTDIMQEVYETMQAGTNMERAGGNTRGENGLGGSTCLLALSSELIVVSTRSLEHKRLTLVYKEAELVDRKLEKYDGPEHGLDVTFKPSKKILGVDKIPVEMLVPWIEEMNYTLNPNINVIYNVRGKEHRIVHKELEEFFESDIPIESRLCKTLKFSCDGKLVEVFDGKSYNRKFSVDVAIMYSDPEKYKGDDIRHSWMNMIHTSQNGAHMDGVVDGFIKYMTEQVCSKHKKLEGADLKKDILAHLNVVINARADVAHMFSAQAKDRVLSKQLKTLIQEATYETLKSKYNPVVGEMVDVIVGNHRARIEGEKARSINSLTRDKKKWTQPDSYYPCSSVKTDMPKELFLVEGESAGGGLKLARDAKYQALLTFRGKSLNVMKGGVDEVKALSSMPLENLTKILGCGIGRTFDIKKLNFKRILISTDADIDGYHIRVILLTFFLEFMPELIRQGYVYVVEPPLYELKQGKNKMYVASQMEYLEKCIDSIGKLEVSFPHAKDVIVVKNAKDFVKSAFDYRATLEEVSIEKCVNRYLLEAIADGFNKYGSVESFIENINEWIKSLINVFPEMSFDDKSRQLHATIDLVDQLVVIDDILMKDLGYVIDIISRYDLLIKFCTNGSEPTTTTLLRFFETIESMYPKILQRYKGLGSSQREITKDIVTDPRTRRAIRVTMNNIHTYTRIGDLMGDSKEQVRHRKELLMEFPFTKDMLDN